MQLSQRDIDEAQIRTRLQRRAELCALGYQSRADDQTLPLAEDLAELAGVPPHIAVAALRVVGMSRKTRPRGMTGIAWAAHVATEYHREHGGRYPSATLLARITAVSRPTAGRALKKARNAISA